MSDEWDDERGESDIRRRAAYLLGMLALVAVLFVVVMVTFVHGSGSKKNGPVADIGGPTGSTAPSATASGPAPGSSSAPRSSTSASRSATPSRTATSTHAGPASCPTAAACALDSDVGNVVAAINAYRTSHGAPAATGGVVKSAQTCAVTNGDNCPSSFFWEPVEKNDGGQVVQKIVSGGGKGSAFLLDPKVSSFAVGWAYIPSTKSYACAVISR